MDGTTSSFGWRMLSQAEQYGEAGVCGMGGSWDPTSPQSVPTMGTIAANGSYTVMHKLHFSLFNSDKLLPVRYSPLEIELSLSSTPGDWLNTADSSSYTVSNMQLLYDAYVLDEAVMNSFYSSLLANRCLSIPTLTVFQFVQTIPSGSTTFDLSCVRAFSRLSHVWLTFRNAGAKSSSFICPTTITGNSGSAPSLSDVALSARLSIGAKNYPDPSPVHGHSRALLPDDAGAPCIPNVTRDIFETSAFNIAFDLRKVPGDPTSSISTRSGDLIRVELKNLTANVAVECWVTMFAFSVTAVRENGVTLLT